MSGVWVLVYTGVGAWGERCFPLNQWQVGARVNWSLRMLSGELGGQRVLRDRMTLLCVRLVVEAEHLAAGRFESDLSKRCCHEHGWSLAHSMAFWASRRERLQRCSVANGPGRMTHSPSRA